MSTKMTILGAGESGTGAALLGKAKGYDVFVSELGQIQDRYKKELLAADVPFEEGRHTEDRILQSALIIKSPGIPDDAPMVLKIRAASIEVIDEVEFAFRHATGNVIAITGTNGKTTTTLLTYHLLKSAGYDVALVGNVGFSFAREVSKHQYDWYVLEVSSFQLDGTRHFSPSIGILLNITPDHLNRYDNSMQKYVNSKFQLIQSMKANQHFIFFADDQHISTELQKRTILPHAIPVSLKSAVTSGAYGVEAKMNFRLNNSQFDIVQRDTTLRGPHNLINTMAAVCAVYLAGATLEEIRKGLKTFSNAPHRLESVAMIQGVEFVNDSKATNVDSVSYALGSYEVPLIWIAGGIDKGNDYSQVADAVRKKVKALICLGKDNTKLKKAFADIVTVIKETESIRESVRMAYDMAEQGDVVLLSPACASFDLFKNYEDRGDQYRNEVHSLKREVEAQQ